MNFNDNSLDSINYKQVTNNQQPITMYNNDLLNQINNTLHDIKLALAEMNMYRFTEQYIDNDHFIQLMNISKRTAQQWRNDGIIPYAQFGKKVYYRLSDLEEIFEMEFKKHRSLKKQQRPKRKRIKVKFADDGWHLDIGNQG